MSSRPAWWLPVLARIWPLTWLGARATAIPVAGKIVALFTLPLFRGKNLNITYLPIDRKIEGAKSSYIPLIVLDELIGRSSHRVIVNRCTCRDASKCANHPVEYACLLLGEGTREIDARIARHVSKDEARAHVRTAVENGLTPMTGRVRVDDFIWGVRDGGRMASVCFCCPCCCTIMRSAKYFPADAAASLVRLKGLRFTVNRDACARCGTCVGNCIMAALSLKDGNIVRDETKCKGCGRCTAVCPEGAVTASVDSLDEACAELNVRMKRYINIE